MSDSTAPVPNAANPNFNIDRANFSQSDGRAIAVRLRKVRRSMLKLGLAALGTGAVESLMRPC